VEHALPDRGAQERGSAGHWRNRSSAPWSDDRSTRRSELPSISPKDLLSDVEGPVLSSVEGPVLSSVEGPVLSSVEGPVPSLPAPAKVGVEAAALQWLGDEGALAAGHVTGTGRNRASSLPKSR